MRNRLGLVFAGLLLVCGGMRAVDSTELALQAAIHMEVVDGDLPGAIHIFEAIVQSGNPATAAQALLHMGRCYQKLGDPKAREVYQRVITQFAGQKNAAEEARNRLAELPKADDKLGTTIGWYNGDWRSGVPGLGNFYRTLDDYARVYDDFVVPEGGWTVAGVFSDNRMDFDGVTQASWEIRKDMSPQSGGTLVASGTSPATQTTLRGPGPVASDPMVGYRIQVDGLHVQLAPGRYWLNVAPIGAGVSYVSATRGRNAIGNPPGNNGMAFFDASRRELRFEQAQTVTAGGRLGIGSDFSQGVLILDKSK